MINKGKQARTSQAKVISFFPQCSIVGTHQCPERVFTHCERCGRAICLYHTESVTSQECLFDHPVCLVCLYPQRYPRDPAVGRWRRRSQTQREPLTYNDIVVLLQNTFPLFDTQP